MTPKPPLTLDRLKTESATFLGALDGQPIPSLFGADNGKALGTYIEAQFNAHLTHAYAYQVGNAASGIDFPTLNVDLKVTSVRQPQSSSPFRDATQKVYGLGYHLLVFVYDKTDDPALQAARLRFDAAVLIDQSRTADYQTTAGLRRLLDADANLDDVIGFLEDRQLPLDEIGRTLLAERILADPPAVGVLTISNALQWRLQYGRALAAAARGGEPGVERLR